MYRQHGKGRQPGNFGKWLNGTDLSAAEKQTDTCREVKQLYATFTSKLGVAASGRKAEAEKAIGIGGSDSQASSALTEAMIRWRSSNK